MPLSVGFCVDNLQVGGTELNAVRTARELKATGVEVVVFAMRADGPLASAYQRIGVEVVPIPLGGSLMGIRAIRQGFRFRSELRRRRLSVLHCHDRYSNVFGVFWGKLAGVPHIVASRRWASEEGPVALRYLNRMAYRLADRVAGNSRRVVEGLIQVDGVPAAKAVLLPNFVEPAAFERMPRDRVLDWRRRIGIPVEGLAVGIVANLRPVKAHEVFLLAVAGLVAKHPAESFVIIGDGTERRRLERIAVDLGIGDRVRFVGELPSRPNVHQLLDVSVLASRAEGFPNTLLEAMAVGVPVVATDVGGVRDAVEHASTGIVVEPGDAQGMAAAIDALLADPERRSEYGRRAIEVVRTRYGVEGMRRALSELYGFPDTINTDSPSRGDVGENAPK